MPLERLRARSKSPFEPQPPRASLAVNAAMWLARFLGKGPAATPHLCGGEDEAKVAWEFREAPELGRLLDEALGPDALRGRDVLDAGCGWGGKAVWLAGHAGPRSVTAFDLPEIFVPAAAAAYAERHGVGMCSFLAGRAEEMPAADASFDVVLMDDVLEHVADPGRVLRECWRVLRPGGSLFVKFPSIRMMGAHHLDRALRFPGLHYLLPMRTWAAGFNALLLDPSRDLAFEPFDRVVRSSFSNREVTANLNGLDLSSFRALVAAVRFRVRRLELVPYAARGGRRFLKVCYTGAFRMPWAREFLANYVLFVGEKPPAAG